MAFTAIGCKTLSNQAVFWSCYKWQIWRKDGTNRCTAGKKWCFDFNIDPNFTFSVPCIMLYRCENDQQDAQFISFICFDYTILYMFRTNQFLIRRLPLYMQHVGISMHVCDVWLLTWYGWNSNLYSFQGLSDQDFIYISCCKSCMLRTHTLRTVTRKTWTLQKF
jgi:hypothetical protein